MFCKTCACCPRVKALSTISGHCLCACFLHWKRMGIMISCSFIPDSIMPRKWEMFTEYLLSKYLLLNTLFWGGTIPSFCCRVIWNYRPRKKGLKSIRYYKWLVGSACFSTWQIWQTCRAEYTGTSRVPTHCVCFQESHVTFVPLQVKSPGPVGLDEFTLCEPHRLLARPRRVWTVWQMHESQLGQRAQEPVGRRMTAEEDESPVWQFESQLFR